MNFDAPEKSLDVFFADATPDLRALPDLVWSAWLATAGVRILSKLSGPICNAYLLSESSLFVFAHRALVITCGGSRLQDSVIHLDAFPVLRDWAQLKTDRLIVSDTHDPTLESTTQPRHPHSQLESAKRHRAVMQSLHAPSIKSFQQNQWQLPCSAILRKYFPFSDFHIFTEPSGYSANYLSATNYATLHISPSPVHSYASFETNLPHHHAIEIMAALRETLHPARFNTDF